MNGTDLLITLKGVGEKSTALFRKCHLQTVADLADHYPRYYEEFKDPVYFDELIKGENCAVLASVHSRMTVKRTRSLKVCVLRVKDQHDTIREIAWFNAPFLANVFHVNQQFIFFGTVVARNGILTFQHPKYYTVSEYEKIRCSFQPVYGLTEGLTNHFMRKCVSQLKPFFQEKQEYLPDRYRQEQQLLSLSQAYENIHFPVAKEQIIAARKRLVFHEFFRFFIWMDALKKECLAAENTFTVKENTLVPAIIEKLPYALTGAQKRTLQEITHDLKDSFVMNRLLQGDVGSGKTIIAILSLVTVVESGYQGALMVPTEVLALQHYEEMKAMLEPYDIRIALLTGSTKGAQKKEIQRQIQDHEVDIIVGTHALIQSKVIYADLALVITDEQHRFGVRQRELFAEKGEHPHVLVMSATPIPRTLALMLYGDMQISVMNELPAKRLPIKNCVVGQSYRPAACRFLDQQIKQGHQAYIICPMVQESEHTEVENVTDYTQRLAQALPQTRIACLHGKMKDAEKTRIMKEFSEHMIDILVSTTVIEVGINVPNATVMMIENAERFGLAQLHQLRGRVGRGQAQSYCIFMYGKDSAKTKERLEVLNQSNDGFYIAQEDLKLRGPGDFFGIRQSGEMDFKLADIFQDADVMTMAHDYFMQCKAAGFDFTQYPDLQFDESELHSI